MHQFRCSHIKPCMCVCVGAFTANCYECVAANYNSQAQCLLDIATRFFNQLVTSISNNCNDALSVISGRRSASPERTRILSYQRPQPIKRVTSAVQPLSTCSCLCMSLCMCVFSAILFNVCAADACICWYLRIDVRKYNQNIQTKHFLQHSAMCVQLFVS